MAKRYKVRISGIVATQVNGWRYAHTPAFREAKRAFPRYEEAEAFLKATAREM